MKCYIFNSFDTVTLVGKSIMEKQKKKIVQPYGS